MFINLNTITDKGIIIDQVVDFEEKYYENTLIKGLENVYVKGRIYYSTTKEVLFEGSMNGNMLINDSNTNEIVSYPFSSEISEILLEDTTLDENLRSNDKNSLDLKEILWQNIVLEVPLTYSKEEKPSTTKGEGWELKSEEDIIDPRLQVFKDLLNDERSE